VPGLKLTLYPHQVGAPRGERAWGRGAWGRGFGWGQHEPRGREGMGWGQAAARVEPGAKMRVRGGSSGRWREAGAAAGAPATPPPLQPLGPAPPSPAPRALLTGVAVPLVAPARQRRALRWMAAREAPGAGAPHPFVRRLVTSSGLRLFVNQVSFRFRTRRPSTPAGAVHARPRAPRVHATPRPRRAAPRAVGVTKPPAPHLGLKPPEPLETPGSAHSLGDRGAVCGLAAADERRTGRLLLR
jgi:hypothetical protein